MGGHSLRSWREKLGLTMRDIETSSEQIARKRSNEEYFIPISRLSDFETKGVIPSIYRLYSLAVIYHKDMRELLAWYGVDLNIPISDLELSSPRNRIYQMRWPTPGPYKYPYASIPRSTHAER